MIKIGDKLPECTFSVLTDEGSSNPTTSTLFDNKKVVVFALPGAFTPTCSAAHLPGFIVKADEIKAKGVDDIICLSVNDAFVMKAWGDANNAEQITMLADGAGSFTQALGLELHTGDFGGLRSKRYAMIVENGVVTALGIDEEAGSHEHSSADAMLKLL